MARMSTALRRKARFVCEQLEDRSVPAALTYVNDNWVLIHDNGDNVLSAGDTVRNDQDTVGAGTITAIYGSTAFGTVTGQSGSGVTLGGGTVSGAATINDAISHTDSGGTVDVLQGSYTESATVTTGVTLTGIGSISGTVTVNSGATVNAGTVGGVGTLTVTNLTVNSGGTLTADINGTSSGAFDQVSASGTVTVTGSTLILHVNSGTTITAGTPIVIVNNTGASAITGTFTGLAEGALVSASNGQQFKISYTGGGGNDITLTAMPLLSYFNDNWAFVTDTDSSGTLTAGDIVSNANDTINAGGVTGVYGVNAFGAVTTGAHTGSLTAFDTITEAIANTSTSGAVNVLQGSYTEDVTVPTGITLTGNGTISGTVTVNSGGVLNAGGGVGTGGTLTVTNLTVNSGGQVTVDLNGTTAGTFDQLSASGTINVTGSTLVVNTGATIPVGSVLTIINNTGSSAITGTFAGLAEGATVTASNGQQFKISYTGGTGNDVTLTAMTALNVDLSITKTDNLKFVYRGGPTTYTITVTNVGTSTVTGAQVTDNLTSELQNVTWTSTSSGGATGSAGSGSGAISEMVNLPVGASVTYTVHATVTRGARGGLTNTATVAAPNGAVDTNMSNNTASDRDTVLPKPVPAFLHQFLTAAGNGLVSLFDASGQLVAQAFPFANFGYTGPVHLAIGDLTGDGVQDYVFTVTQGPLAGLVEVVDGATLTLLGTAFAFPGFTGGVNVAIGDIDGDGTNDLILTTATGGSQVEAFNLVTRTRIANFTVLPGFTGGLTVTAGDVNGDGVDEIIVGFASGLPVVAVYDETGKLLDAFLAYNNSYLGGINVAAGDILGNDGVAEILIAPVTGGAQGLLEVFQFGNHNPVESANLPLFGVNRGINIAISDIDGDGDQDIILSPGLGQGRGSRVLAFNSRTGNLLRDFDLFPNILGGVDVD